jgi:NDP-sugar pyrophosphorylase family protein
VILDPGQAPGSAAGAGKIPGALRDVAGRPLIEHQLDFLFRGGVDSACVCTGQTGYGMFRDWLRSCGYTGRVELVKGGGNTEGSGILRDLGLVLERGNFNGGVVVTSGNRYFDFPFEDFMEFSRSHGGDAVVIMKVRSSGKAVRCGMAAVTANERVISFEVDRDGGAKAGLAALPLIHLSSETIPYLNRYLAEGNDAGCIGSFLEWSYRFRPLFAYRAEGKHFRVTDAASARRMASHFEKTGRR